MRPPLELVAKRRDDLENRTRVRLQRRLRLDPRLRMREGLEDSSAVARSPLDHALIDQKQQNSGSPDQRQFRPMCGIGEVIFEMETDVS